MSRLLAAAFVAIVALVAACGGSSVSTAPSELPAALDPAGAWQLVAGTVDGQPLPLVEDARVTLIVDGSNVSGQAACNQYFGEFTLIDGQVTIPGVGQTEMACAEPVMVLEAAYTSALAKVDSAHMDGPALVLTGKPGIELRFERLQPPPMAELVDTHWVLESLVMGDTVSSVVGGPVTLLLNADGSLEGSTGCQRLTGHFLIRGDEVYANEFGVDGKCPAGGMRAQSNHVARVIGDGFVASIDGDLLYLGKEDGSGLVYRAAE
jgi:heat shock protein HslJ